MKLSTKDHLLKGIEAGGEEQNQAILQLWKRSDRKCRRVIRKGKGSAEDLEDTRQEATMLLIEALRAEKFRGNTDGELVAFFNQTFLYVWMARVRKRDKMPAVDLASYELPMPNMEDWLIAREQQKEIYKKMESCLRSLDEKGRKIIQWRYFQKPPRTWTEIASMLEYQTTQTAQNKGGKVMKKLRLCMEGK